MSGVTGLFFSFCYCVFSLIFIDLKLNLFSGHIISNFIWFVAEKQESFEKFAKDDSRFTRRTLQHKAQSNRRTTDVCGSEAAWPLTETEQQSLDCGHLVLLQFSPDFLSLTIYFWSIWGIFRELSGSKIYRNLQGCTKAYFTLHYKLSWRLCSFCSLRDDHFNIFWLTTWMLSV